VGFHAGVIENRFSIYEFGNKTDICFMRVRGLMD